VPVGGRIRLHGTVAEATAVANDGVQLTVDFTVELEGSDKPACVAQAVYRQYA
jgi:acyl dehydratase